MYLQIELSGLQLLGVPRIKIRPNERVHYKSDILDIGSSSLVSQSPVCCSLPPRAVRTSSHNNIRTTHELPTTLYIIKTSSHVSFHHCYGISSRRLRLTIMRFEYVWEDTSIMIKSSPRGIHTASSHGRLITEAS